MRPEKQLIENEYAGHVRRSGAVIVTEYKGLSSETFNRLRSEMVDLGGDCLVVKNRIFRRLLKDSGLESLGPFFQGQIAVVLTDNELPKLLKMIIRYEKEEGAPRIKAALWGGDFFEADDCKKLAELPPREELLSRVFAGMQAPVNGLVRVLNGVIFGLVMTIKAIHKQRSN